MKNSINQFKSICSKFIQFGKDEDEEYRWYGARETYLYKIGCMEKFQVMNVDKVILSYASGWEGYGGRLIIEY